MSLQHSRAQLLVQLLDKLQDAVSERLTIVETGSIRSINEPYVLGDGHSTHIIADWLSRQPRPHDFYSIDLDTTIAEDYLKKLGLADQVVFLQGNSLDVLPKLSSARVHLAYLDSANDAALIEAEFKILEKVMAANVGVVVVDDCKPGSHELLKGNLVIPYAKAQGYRVTLTDRQGIIWFS